MAGRKRIDITGQRYGRWTVLEFATTRRAGTSRVSWFKCKCECGTETYVRSTDLRAGRSKSCGCMKNKTPPRRAVIPWDEKLVERLRKLWLEGYSGSQIADIFGYPGKRSAIIGKVNRLGLKRLVPAPVLSGKNHPCWKGGAEKARARDLAHQRERRRVERISAVKAPAAGRFVKRIQEAPVKTLAWRGSIVCCPEPVSIWDAGMDHCRYIVTPDGTLPDDLRFCGNQVIDGMSWCEAHARMCLNLPRQAKAA